MRSIFQDKERQALHRRIDGLRPESRGRWGRMNAHQMICHLKDAIESGFGASPATPATGALTRFPIRWLVINVLPWPKGKLQSPPDLLRTHMDHHLRQFGV